MPLTPSLSTSHLALNGDILYAVLGFSLSTLDLDHLALFMANRHLGQFRHLLAPDHNVLLVSKQWYRIGLPLLYRHIVLRNASRTTAVMDVLASKIWLGPAIRILSISGGMGSELSRLSDLCPNIDTLVLDTCSILSAHSAQGLLYVLPRLKLKALLYDRRTTRQSGNAVTRKIDQAVRGHMVDTWSSSLKSVSICEHHNNTLDKPRFMIDVLLQLPFLEELRLTTEFLYDNLKPGRDESAFRRLLGAPRFKVIRCLGRRHQNGISRCLQAMRLPQDLCNKVVFISVATDYDLYQDRKHAGEIFRDHGLVYESGHQPTLPLLSPARVLWV